MDVLELVIGDMDNFGAYLRMFRGCIGAGDWRHG